MNKKVTITVAVIILLLIGGGAYFMSTNRSEMEPISTGGENENTQETKQSAATSIKDLLASGTAQKCTYKDISNDVDIEGATYIANGKVRSDFTSTSEGKTTTGHTIFDGKVSYVWMDDTSTGYKMEIDTSQTDEDESEPSSQQGMDINKTIDYDCSAWIPDLSLFNPPTNITFQSFAQSTLPSGSPVTGNQSLCSSCDNLTGEQKTQCLTALNCN